MNTTAATLNSYSDIEIYASETVIEQDGFQILVSRAVKVTRPDGTEQYSIPFRGWIKSRQSWAKTWKNGFFTNIPK